MWRRGGVADYGGKVMPHDHSGDYDPVAARKAALAQYEREKHLMPSGKTVTEMLPQGPTIEEVFLQFQRRKHAVLIARAKSWTAGDCSFEHRPTMALIADLIAALEGKATTT